MAVRRIAVCGAGVAGPTLTSILSKRLGSRVKIDVFERTPDGSDQGYGLDLDTFGQQALVEAGVYGVVCLKPLLQDSDVCLNGTICNLTKKKNKYATRFFFDLLFFSNEMKSLVFVNFNLF